LAIIEVTPDLSAPTTAQRLLTIIYEHPEGSTIGQLATSLNRPVSMIQICLKDPRISRYILAKMRNDGQAVSRIYLPKHPQSPSVDITNIEPPTIDPEFLRERAGLSRQQIATSMSVSHRQVENWEKGKSHPKLSPAQFQKMLDIYQCTLDELVAAFSNFNLDRN
jgi:DNA-binding transcriptional regulator YiaG